MKDLKGKKVGISKSLNTIKNDWWRIQEYMGIENMLMLNDMTMDDIDVDKWAAPEFLEQAAMEVLKEEWQRRSWSKLPQGGGIEVEGTRAG